MDEPSYGFGVTVRGESLESVAERVTAALGEQGFGVLATIDIAGALKKKLDVDFRPYVILGACNPKLAVRALGDEPHMGLLLPCNVVVQAGTEAGAYDVSFIDPSAMIRAIESPSEAVNAVAADADRALRAVVDALKA